MTLDMMGHILTMKAPLSLDTLPQKKNTRRLAPRLFVVALQTILPLFVHPELVLPMGPALPDLPMPAAKPPVPARDAPIHVSLSLAFLMLSRKWLLQHDPGPEGSVSARKLVGGEGGQG
jgi:hypothetical protein